MEHQEEVVLILVYFGALYAAQRIIEVQGVKVVVLRQIIGLKFRRRRDIEPLQVTPGDLLDIQL